MMKKTIKIMLLILIVFTSFSSVTSAYVGDNSYIYDNWGKSIPAPAAYIVDMEYSGNSLGTTAFENPQDLFVSKKGEIYIADTGNNRIVVLSSDYKIIRQITNIGKADMSDLKEPQGVFIDKEGFIYICDSGNKRVIKLDSNLNYVLAYEKPNSDLFPKDVEFKPLKVVADDVGNVFVVAYGVYNGLIKYDKNGNFDGFFGTNKVEVTADILARQFWKQFFTDEQQQATVRFLPIEYTNLCINNENYIYALALQTSTSLDEVKKINAQGKNVMRYSNIGTNFPKNDFGDIEKNYISTTAFKDNRLVAVDVDNEGIMALLDAERGHVFLYDQDINMLCVFGETGNNVGAFKQAVDIVKAGNNYIVLDSVKKNIVVFKPTDYINRVREAISYYTAGKYIESIDLWKDIIKYNSNCLVAYKSIGKALFQQGDYKGAMEYLKKGDDREGYSDAFYEYRKEFVRKNIIFIIIFLILLFFFINYAFRFIRKLLGLKSNRKRILFK